MQPRNMLDVFAEIVGTVVLLIVLLLHDPVAAVCDFVWDNYKSLRKWMGRK